MERTLARLPDGATAISSPTAIVPLSIRPATMRRSSNL
jgi:hypothetical protein